MKRKGLVYKLIITFSGILALILITLALVLSLWFKNYFFRQKIQELDRQSKVISDSVLSYLNGKENSKQNELKDCISFVGNSMDVDILITDNIGYVYEVSSDKFIENKYTNIGVSQKNMDKLKSGLAIEHGGREIMKTSPHTYLKPIFQDSYFRGIIVMITSEQSIRSGLKHVYEIVWLSAIVAVIVAAIIIYYFAKKIIINPLNEINIAARRLARGDVGKRVDITSNDEIGELAHSFNVMAESIEESDKNRRDFISNVSHELRSPITSIKGFVAGILDGVIPKDKENYYLNIVYDEIRRLSRLVIDLLDISAMEEGKFKLNMVEFDINILIKQCIAKFDGKIRNKGVNVEVTFGREHEFVYADRDRLIQVLTNIIDNAMKYSNDNGNIKITTNDKGSKVYVSVFNNGPLLKDEELARIWDRFYKSDKARTNKDSTGLGLPIVRLILAQHGEDIWVNNEQDGVRFTFTISKI
ncbi:HAMP domain-containing sensor histidine kinase [Clostridium paraputrificum]|uniref:HAMP domain-containing sensor histidine kinase n=1 Tax=Clostridium paraputrificum TaxID=29363 RepID=UPI000C07F87A|nr:HAMP domain-containing sensor histidine kinase [Clostridium paraputrificum]